MNCNLIVLNLTVSSIKKNMRENGIFLKIKTVLKLLLYLLFGFFFLILKV